MKSKGIAYLLFFLSIFGWLGLHRFYLKRYGTGILWILTGALFGIGGLFDLITLSSKVHEYNTDLELKTLRTVAMSTANTAAAAAASSLVNTQNDHR